MTRSKILVTGANGQIGSVLVKRLNEIHGTASVIASDIRQPEKPLGRFKVIDVLDLPVLMDCVRDHQITEIYHLAAILSAVGEQDPIKTWQVNMGGLFNVLEVAKSLNTKLFFPSSIAVFGGHSPRINTPQYTITEPESVYGISKLAGEHWCNYYHRKYGVDVRSVRFPGLVGHQSLPGGGTTDYAVEIFHHALRSGVYSCFLKPDTSLPMLYMDDAIDAVTKIMTAPSSDISVRTSYNLAGMSFTPAEIAGAIRQHLPEFEINYAPDYRQKIADSWPATLDDRPAREDWGWQPQWDLPKMTAAMLNKLMMKNQDNITHLQN